jgi:regulator of replication initiation timing
MDLDLDRLEEKVTKLVGISASLRLENQQLRNELLRVTQESTKLKNNMLQASNQLEMLLDALPAEDEQS